MLQKLSRWICARIPFHVYFSLRIFAQGGNIPLWNREPMSLNVIPKNLEQAVQTVKVSTINYFVPQAGLREKRRRWLIVWNKGCSRTWFVL